MGLVKMKEASPAKYVPVSAGGDEDEVDFEEDEDAAIGKSKDAAGTMGWAPWAGPMVNNDSVKARHDKPAYSRSSRTNTHVLADMKRMEMERLGGAIGVRPDREVGSAFKGRDEAGGGAQVEEKPFEERLAEAKARKAARKARKAKEVEKAKEEKRR
ncbi:hypothetical protein TrRE_jg7121, partial [Triparma retinervis]